MSCASFHSGSNNQELTDYMRRVIQSFVGKPPMRMLDIPAGAGQLSDALRELGHEVVCADLAQARPDYVRVDMNHDLPFEDASFDAVLCLEGLEHMLEPDHLIKELLRVCRVGGMVVLSTPNVLSYYSRLQFLLTGTLYQFLPANVREIGRDELTDRFHIAPVDYLRLRYMAEYFGGRVESIATDKYKRKVLMPLYVLIWLLGLPWALWIFFGPWANREHMGRNREMFSHINSPALLFGRSLVMFLRKVEHVRRMPSDGIN
ncbi:MAG: class I SAM-dependent methyltransferase [Planctomycetes bacterium]|nr:class I SAM-dependent methyltransferase [Planctomycetota bacterium]